MTERITVSMDSAMVDLLHDVADSHFTGNKSRAAAWAFQLLAEVARSERLRDRRLTTPAAAIEELVR